MKQNPNYILKELAGVPYLLPYGQMIADHRRGIKLNETGVYFWNLLKEDMTLEEILYAGKKHYQIPDENVSEFEQDIKVYLNTLLVHNILLDASARNEPSVFDEKYVCIAGLHLRFINFGTAFPEEFNAFLSENDAIADQTIIFHTGHPLYNENGKLLIRNQELQIMETPDKYIVTFPQAKGLFDMHLSLDGTYVDIYGIPSLSDNYKEDLFHAIRLPFLYLAQMHNMAALHSVSILYRDKAWLFSGPSGTGKSTHANLWEKYLNVHTVNGDLNLLALDGPVAVVHGIPWCGTSGICDTKTYELGGITLLKQAPANYINELTEDEKILLVSQRLISPNWNKWQFNTNLCITEKIVRNKMICRLHCTKDKEAMEIMKQHIDKFLGDA